MEVEFTVLSDRREGLLRELGNLVIKSGFSLLRQKLSVVETGVQLWLRVSGREERLLELEERLGSHPLVLSFESEHESRRFAGGQPAAPPSVRPPVPERRVSASPPVRRLSIDQDIETQLSALAREYPRIFPRLLQIQDSLSAGQRAGSMAYVGRRVGAWVYKRDYSLGGRLGFSASLKNIALPAMRDLISADLKEHSLKVKDNPLCMPGSRCRSGDFFCGFLHGLLEEAGITGQLVVREIHCRSEGAESCVFEVVN